MSEPTFGQGVLLALGLALTASVLAALQAALLWPPHWAGALLVFGLYAVYLLRACGPRAGRALLCATWLACTLASLLWWREPVALLVSQTALLWLLRSTLLQHRPLRWLTDGLLCCLAASAGIWAYGHSGSIGLATWSYFLVQAAHPCLWGGSGRHAPGAASAASRFERASRQADAALSRLIRNAS